jgi:hypothetical protein
MRASQEHDLSRLALLLIRGHAVKLRAMAPRIPGQGLRPIGGIHRH